MTILITGATGMIGAHLLDALHAAGMPVRILSRRPADPKLAHEARLLPPPDAPQGAFEEAVAGATHVVHCAALNSDRKAGESDFFAANATLTHNLARAAARAVPGRFVYLSSTRAMADAWETAELSEDSACRPTSAYGRSKLEGERLLKMAYAEAGRQDGAVLRLPPVYGIGMRGQLGALLKLADTPLPLPLKGYGERRTLLSCDAAVRAIMLLLERKEPAGAPYLAGDLASVDTGDILSAFRAGLSRPQRLFAVQESLLRTAATLVLQGKAARLLAAGQTVHSNRLTALGWMPEPDTGAALAELAIRISRCPATA